MSHGLTVDASARPQPERQILVGVLLAELGFLALGFLVGRPVLAAVLAGAVAYFLVALRSPDVAWALVWVTVPPNIEVLLGPGTAITLPTEPMMMLALLAWLLRSLADRRWKVPSSPLHLPLAILGALALLSATWSVNPIATLKSWIMMAGYVAFGYLYYLEGRCDPHRRRKWLLLVAITGAAWGAFGVMRVLFPGEIANVASIASTYSYGAFRPFFREHGTYAAYLSMLLPAALLFAMERTGKERIVYGVSAFLIGTGVILAFARAGWLAVALVIPSAVFAWAWQRKSARRLVAPAAMILLVALILAVSGIGRQVTRHAESTVSAVNPSNLERLNRWSAALAMTRDRPMTGVGFGCYSDAYRSYRTKARVTDQAFNRMGTHSEPLKLLSEMGIPGLLAATVFLFAVARLALRCFRRLLDPEERVLALAAFAGVSTYVVNGMFNSYLVEDKVTIPFWAAIGVIGALGRRLEERGEDAPGMGNPPARAHPSSDS